MPGRVAFDPCGNTSSYSKHELCSLVRYIRRWQPYGANRRCDKACGTRGVGNCVLELVDNLTSFARVAGAMDVAQSGLRHRCGPVDELAISVHCTLVVAQPCLGRCSATEGLLFLGPYYFDSSRRGKLGFACRQISVWNVLCTIYVVCDGRPRVVQIVVLVDRI